MCVTESQFLFHSSFVIRHHTRICHHSERLILIRLCRWSMPRCNYPLDPFGLGEFGKKESIVPPFKPIRHPKFWQGYSRTIVTRRKEISLNKTSNLSIYNLNSIQFYSERNSRNLQSNKRHDTYHLEAVKLIVWGGWCCWQEDLKFSLSDAQLYACPFSLL